MHCKLKDMEQISFFLQSFDQHHGTIQTLSNPYYKDNDKYMIKLSGSRISQLMTPIDVIPLRLLLSSSSLFLSEWSKYPASPTPQAGIIIPEFCSSTQRVRRVREAEWQRRTRERDKETLNSRWICTAEESERHPVTKQLLCQKPGWGGQTHVLPHSQRHAGSIKRVDAWFESCGSGSVRNHVGEDDHSILTAPIQRRRTGARADCRRWARAIAAAITGRKCSCRQILLCFLP